MISDFRVMRLRILRGVTGKEKEIEIQPAKQSRERVEKKKNNKNLDKKNHQIQSTSSNSSGNIQRVIYGGEEMALFEGCHVWAL